MNAKNNQYTSLSGREEFIMEVADMSIPQINATIANITKSRTSDILDSTIKQQDKLDILYAVRKKRIWKVMGNNFDDKNINDVEKVLNDINISWEPIRKFYDFIRDGQKSHFSKAILECSETSDAFTLNQYIEIQDYLFRRSDRILHAAYTALMEDGDESEIRRNIDREFEKVGKFLRHLIKTWEFDFERFPWMEFMRGPDIQEGKVAFLVASDNDKDAQIETYLSRMEQIYSENYSHDPDLVSFMIENFRKNIQEGNGKFCILFVDNENHRHCECVSKNIAGFLRLTKNPTSTDQNAMYLGAVNITKEFQWYAFLSVLFEEEARRLFESGVKEIHAHAIAGSNAERVWLEHFGFIAAGAQGNFPYGKNQEKILVGTPLLLTKENFDAAMKRKRAVITEAASQSEQGVLDGSEKVNDVLSLESNVLTNIQNLMENPENRPLQTRAYCAIGNSIAQGKRSGIIKLPTGTWKTRVFAHILRAMGKNGLTLIPRTPLFASTKKEFLLAGHAEKDIYVADESSESSADWFANLLSNGAIDWKSGKIQVICTYQSLLALQRSEPKIFDQLVRYFWVVINDEAHRGLGDKTRAASDAIGVRTDVAGAPGIDSTDIEAMKEFEQALQNEDAVMAFLEWYAENRYQYFFTATPVLLEKSLADISEYLLFATIEEAVREWSIILPQHKPVGEAFLRSGLNSIQKWDEGFIEQVSEGDGFVDQNGTSMRTVLIEAYKELLAKHSGRLPAVGFASTKKEAADIVLEFRKMGIRAERVTSDPSDISPDEAIARMDRNELDVMVTVSKVGEGFDYPDLAASIWFSPSRSSAKILQGNGRISRVTPEKKPENILSSDGKLVCSPAAYVIEPNCWHGVSSDDDRVRDRKKSIEGVAENKRKIGSGIGDNDFILGNTFEWYFKSGEISYYAVDPSKCSVNRDLWQMTGIPGNSIEIDGDVQVGLTRSDPYWQDSSGNWLLEEAKKQKVSVISGRTEDGRPIYFVPKKWADNCQITKYINRHEYEKLRKKIDESSASISEFYAIHPEIRDTIIERFWRCVKGDWDYNRAASILSIGLIEPEMAIQEMTSSSFHYIRIIIKLIEVICFQRTLADCCQDYPSLPWLLWEIVINCEDQGSSYKELEWLLGQHPLWPSNIEILWKKIFSTYWRRTDVEKMIRYRRFIVEKISGWREYMESADGKKIGHKIFEHFSISDIQKRWLLESEFGITIPADEYFAWGKKQILTRWSSWSKDKTFATILANYSKIFEEQRDAFLGDEEIRTCIHDNYNACHQNLAGHNFNKLRMFCELTNIHFDASKLATELVLREFRWGRAAFYADSNIELSDLLIIDDDFLLALFEHLKETAGKGDLKKLDELFQVLDWIQITKKVFQSHARARENINTALCESVAQGEQQKNNVIRILFDKLGASKVDTIWDKSIAVRVDQTVSTYFDTKDLSALRIYLEKDPIGGFPRVEKCIKEWANARNMTFCVDIIWACKWWSSGFFNELPSGIQQGLFLIVSWRSPDAIESFLSKMAPEKEFYERQEIRDAAQKTLLRYFHEMEIEEDDPERVLEVIDILHISDTYIKQISLARPALRWLSDIKLWS